MFRKSSYCISSDCVEVGFMRSSRCDTSACVEVGFRKSSRSAGNGACVEVGTCTCHGVLVRDSKDPDGPVLNFSTDSWRALIAGIKAGELDL